MRAEIIYDKFPEGVWPSYKYGNNSLFWSNQHIWFSQDMRSFDIDANIKGTQKHKSTRGLACICLEVYDNLKPLTVSR